MAAHAATAVGRLIENTSRLRAPLKPTHFPERTSSSSISGHLAAGRLHAALDALASAAGPVHPSVYSSLLHRCTSSRSLPAALRVASHLSAVSTPPSPFLFNRAIEALAACGGLAEARKLFDEMPHRDGGSWNAIIAASARSDRPRDALALFSRMNREGVYPKDVTLATVLACCADLLELSVARQAHGLVLKLGFCSNVILGTSLVDIYGKCSAIDDAKSMFDSIKNPNAVCWNVIVRRYLEAGMGQEAVGVFFQMIQASVMPLSFTVSNALLACSDNPAVMKGCQIHGFVVKTGYECDILVQNSILQMYVKCEALEDAHRFFCLSDTKDVVLWTSMVSAYVACGRISEAEHIFEGMPQRNIVSWNAMLSGYVRFSSWDNALELFRRMQRETEVVDSVTLNLMLGACAGLFDLEKGKQVHGLAYRRGFCFDLLLSNALLAMYAKCGCLRTAELLFIRMASQRDRVSWNSLITGYERHYRSEEALNALTYMLRETTPNEFTFSSVLAACANIYMLDHGKQIHAYMIRNGLAMDDIIRAALVDMYSKCRLIEYSIKVFEQKRTSDVVLWNSIVLGCAYNGRGEHSLELFEEMRRSDIKADNVTFVGALLACISEGYVDLGRRYFSLMGEEYAIIPRLEHYECMIELLGKHGFMVELEEFVDQMPFEPTMPMWTRIFDSCREYGNKRLGEKAERCINKSNPLNPVRFEVLPEADSVEAESTDCG